MKTAQIVAMQSRIDDAGFSLVADGQWGAKSSQACKDYLRSLMPSPNLWPASNDVSMNGFFGRAGDESNLVALNVAGLGVCYDGVAVRSIRCNKRVADSLGRIITAIAASPYRGILSKYAGCFNFRPMRGGSRPSTHAWGAAIDLAPDTNGNTTPWPQVATMPLEVAEIFAGEGWIAAGPFWGRDGMHFQATR